MKKCEGLRKKNQLIIPGVKVKISENAEEDAPDNQDETLIRSKHAGKEGKYIEDIVTKCKVRFAVIELADGTRVPIRKRYIDPLPVSKEGTS
ncbi:MAG: hypothetical protein JSV31_29970 [Desulfobacterales bacterium]|nr:MAG: hypothetical protein JSV31_29970 [Desulfobacterales bacterium]